MRLAWRIVRYHAAVIGLLTLLTLPALAQQGQLGTLPAVTHPPVGVAPPFDPNDPNWIKAKETVYKSVMEILAQHQAELDQNIRYHKLMHGDREKKYIALTFDDGPHPQYTSRLLALLKQNHVKATFFVVGEMVERYPQLLKQIAAGGHTIGNHTFHHLNLTKISKADAALEIQACNEAVKRVTGRTPYLFRPPGGDYNHQIAEISEAEKMTMVLWSDDPGDFAKPGSKVIATRLLTKVRGGAIILLHDGIQQTLDLLPFVIDTLRSEGYQFVTVDQLINLENLDKPAKTDSPSSPEKSSASMKSLVPARPAPPATMMKTRG